MLEKLLFRHLKIRFSDSPEWALESEGFKSFQQNHQGAFRPNRVVCFAIIFVFIKKKLY